MESKKETTAAEAKMPSNFGEKIIDLSGRFKCLKPCYIFKQEGQKKVGSKHDPFHWIIKTSGYAMLNLVIQFRGKPGKYFRVQVRHHHPAKTSPHTCTFVTHKEEGTLGPAGFELATFNGIRPLMPEVDIIAFSDDAENFDYVGATIYATIA